VWPEPPPAAWPAAAPPPSRYGTIATVSLVLAIGEIVYSLWRLASPLFSHALLEAERRALPTTKSGPSFAKMTNAAEAFAAKIQVWEAVRTAPFLLASVVLLWIALRLRKADAKALVAAKTWALVALGVVVFSLLIQIVVTVPATMEYQRVVVDMIPTMPKGASAPPFDIKQMTSSITIASMLIGLVVGTAMVTVWPIGLYFWAAKLLRETADHAGSPR
jgi:hypothetical protein